MIIEVTGTGTRNKGAELLLVAVARRMASRPDVQLAVNGNFGPYPARAKHGLWNKVEIDRPGLAKLGFALLPPAFRRAYGLVTETDIGGVIDAAGFAFGDQLPVGTAQRFAADCARWKAQGKSIVLLPQALGPFRKPEARAAFREIVRSVDLLFARDEDSLRYAREAAAEWAEKIFTGPDITIGLSGEAPIGDALDDRTALLVPNARMLDRTSAEDSRAYVPFLAESARVCRETGLEPRMLIHDAGEDEALIEPVREALGADLPVIREVDPLRLKGILRQARLVIGSRFHALVGALSGGVPALAVGWSHKYHRLFEDFQCPEMTAGINTDAAELRRIIGRLVGEREERAAKLRAVTGGLRAELEVVWQRVEQILLPD